MSEEIIILKKKLRQIRADKRHAVEKEWGKINPRMDNWGHIKACLALELSFVDVISHTLMINTVGITYTYFTMLAFTIVLHAPYYLFTAFFGLYTRRSFIRFWDICPLFSGIWVIIIFHMIHDLIYSGVYSVVLLRLISNSLSITLPWMNCNFSGASSRCITLENNPVGWPSECEKGKPNFSYSTQDFFNVFYGVMISPELMFQRVRIDFASWLLSSSVTFTLLFLVISLKKMVFFAFMNDVFTILTTIFFPFLTYVYFVTMNIPGFPKNFENTWNMMATREAILYTFPHIMYLARPGEYIYLGKEAQNTVDLCGTAIIIFLIKFLVYATMDMWQVVLIFWLKEAYKVEHTTCIESKENEAWLSMATDVLSRTVLSQVILSTYFLMLFLWNMQTMAMRAFIVVDTLHETFPRLNRHKMLYSFGFTTLCCVFCCLHYLMVFRVILLTLRRHLLRFVTINYMPYTTMSLMFYSLQRFYNDYHFSYGMPLDKYWIIIMKIFCFASIIAYIWNLRTAITFHSPSSILGILIFVFPLMFVGIRQAIPFREKKIGALVKPRRQWGPPEKRLAMNRNRFFPQKKTKFMNPMWCQHNCLLNSNELANEVKIMEEYRKLVKHLYDLMKNSKSKW